MKRSSGVVSFTLSSRSAVLPTSELRHSSPHSSLSWDAANVISVLALLPIRTSWSSGRWDFFGSCLLAFAFVALPRGSHDSSSGRLVLDRHRVDSASLPARVHLQIGDQPDTWMRTRRWSRVECAIKRRPFASALTSTLIAWQRKSFTAALIISGGPRRSG